MKDRSIKVTVEFTRKDLNNILSSRDIDVDVNDLSAKNWKELKSNICADDMRIEFIEASSEIDDFLCEIIKDLENEEVE